MMTPEEKLDFRNFADETKEDKIREAWRLHKNRLVLEGDPIVFFYLPGDGLKERMDLRRFITQFRNGEEEANIRRNENKHCPMVIVADTEVTFMNFNGWQEDIDFCYSLQNSDSAMKNLVRRLVRYPFDKTAPNERLKTRTKGRIRLEPIFKICYFLADGSFTEVRLSNGTKRVESKRIKFYEELLKSIATLERIHRSYIINRDRVLTIDSKANKVVFSADFGRDPREVTFTEEILKRIKKFVYWY